jgi:hypothetical protein
MADRDRPRLRDAREREVAKAAARRFGSGLRRHCRLLLCIDRRVGPAISLGLRVTQQ